MGGWGYFILNCFYFLRENKKKRSDQPWVKSEPGVHGDLKKQEVEILFRKTCRVSWRGDTARVLGVTRNLLEICNPGFCICFNVGTGPMEVVFHQCCNFMGGLCWRKWQSDWKHVMHWMFVPHPMPPIYMLNFHLPMWLYLQKVPVRGW